MVRQYTFIPAVFCVLAALAYWSNQERTLDLDLNKVSDNPVSLPLASSSASPSASPSTSSDQFVPETRHRKELLEALDGLVSYEHYYRSVYGQFTQFIHRIGYPLPLVIRELYEVRVSEATQDRLVITAFSEFRGRTTDLVTVDHNYEVHANFPIPVPGAEFLRGKAQKHLRALREAASINPARLIEEQGVFKGFFKFEIRKNEQGNWSAFAVGLKQPVVGMQLEITASEAAMQAPLAVGEVFLLGGAPLFQVGPQRTGQRPVSNVHQIPTGYQGEQSAQMSPDEMTLAQRIFYGEIGRYANSWAELSRIARFRMAGADSDPSWVDVELDHDKGERGLSSTGSKANPGLEIEPILEPTPEGS